MILIIILAKVSGEKIGIFLLKLLPIFAKTYIITLFFAKNAIFSPKIGKNCRKL
jgi:hypothetical protein